MEQVLGKVAVADKLDDALKELRDLSSIASAAENGYVTRNNALSNFGRLKDDIAKQNGTQADIGSPQPGKNELAFNKDKDVGQRAYVLTKQAQVQKALESEIERLSKNTIELDAQKPSEATKTFATTAAKKVWADAPAQPLAGGTLTISGATTVNGGILFLNDNVVLNRVTTTNGQPPAVSGLEPAMPQTAGVVERCDRYGVGPDRT